MRRSGLVWVLLAVALAAGAAWLAWRPSEPVADAAPVPPAPAPPPAAEAAPAPPDPSAPDASAGAEHELGGTWENVDLEAIRRELPDNLYFEMAMPTDDPSILEARDAERARWNDEYGKVLSGNATEEEITAYYDHRHRVSSDYVEFTRYVLAHHVDELPPRDVALLELAEKMHEARLEEIPRKLEEARERKRQQDEARARWQAEEEEFRGVEGD
jgi:hypothetical protein